MSRYPDILKWPVGEALMAYEAKRKERELRLWTVNYVVWAIGAVHGSKKKPPEYPDK